MFSDSEVYKPGSISLPTLSYTLAILQFEMPIYCPYVQLWTATGPKFPLSSLMELFGGGEKNKSRKYSENMRWTVVVGIFRLAVP